MSTKVYKVYKDRANPAYSESLEVAKGKPEKKEVAKKLAGAICLEVEGMKYKKCEKRVKSALLKYKEQKDKSALKKGEDKYWRVFSDDDGDGKLEFDFGLASMALKKFKLKKGLRSTIFGGMATGTNVIFGGLPLTEYRHTPPIKDVSKKGDELDYPFARDDIKAAVKYFQNKYFKDLKKPENVGDKKNISILSERVKLFSDELQKYLRWSSVHAGSDVTVNAELIPEAPDEHSRIVYNRMPSGKLIKVCTGFGDAAAYIMSDMKFASGERIFTTITNVDINFEKESIGHFFIAAKTEYKDVPVVVSDNMNVSRFKISNAIAFYGTVDEEKAYMAKLEDIAGGAYIGSGKLKTRLTSFKDFGGGKYVKFDNGWSKFHWSAAAVKGIMHATWGLGKITQGYDPLPIVSWNSLDFARVVKEYLDQDFGKLSPEEKLGNIIPREVDYKVRRNFKLGLALTLYEAAILTSDHKEMVAFANYASQMVSDVETFEAMPEQGDKDLEMYELVQLQRSVFNYQLSIDVLEAKNREVKTSTYFAEGFEKLGNDIDMSIENSILQTVLQEKVLQEHSETRDFIVAILKTRGEDKSALSRLTKKILASEDGESRLGAIAANLVTFFPERFVKPIWKYIKNSQPALREMGYSLNANRSYNKAMQVLGKAHRLDKKNFLTAYQYMKSLVAKGYKDAAKDVFFRVKDYSPKDPFEALLMAKMGKMYVDSVKREHHSREDVSSEEHISEVMQKNVKASIERISKEDLEKMDPAVQIEYHMIKLEMSVRDKGNGDKVESRITKLKELTDKWLETDGDIHIYDDTYGTLFMRISEIFRYYGSGTTNGAKATEEDMNAKEYSGYAKSNRPEFRQPNVRKISKLNVTYGDEDRELVRQAKIALDPSRDMREREEAVDRIAATPYLDLRDAHLKQLAALVGRQVVAGSKMFTDEGFIKFQDLPAYSLANYMLTLDIL